MYQVPIRDKGGRLHIVQCYGLKEIVKDLPSTYKKTCRKLCDAFGVSMSEVARPRKIDLLLVAKSNHLMSDEVLKVINGVKLYRGPLGKTFVGTPDSIHYMEPIEGYPTYLSPMFSLAKCVRGSS